MRIQTSVQYHHGDQCDVRDCQRNYCKDHRLLWSDCDTAKIDWEGSGRKMWMLGACPACETQARRKSNAWLQRTREGAQRGKL